VRRLLVVNALIFAVLAAAAALAYYGFSATTESSLVRERALMHDLAEEKVLNIEFLIDDAQPADQDAVLILVRPLEKG